MARFNTPVITNAGINIINRAINGENLEFSSIKIGDGTYTGSEDLRTFTELVGYKNTFNISAASVDGNVLKINATVSNENVNVGYQIKEVGIYGKVGNQETLIAIATAINPDFLADRTSAPVTIIIEFYLTIDRASEINFTYSIPSGVYVDVITFDTGLKNIENKINQKLKKVTVVEVPVGGWEGTTIFKQRINIAGIKANDIPIVSHKLEDGISDAIIIKGLWKAYSCLDKAVVYDGYIELICFRKKPQRSFYLAVKEV
nr:MAG TPA: tail collar fiber protein [Caudoviricetes sp.]